MEYHEKVLQLARIQPVQPTKVAKELGTDSYLASAILSELVEKGKLKVSSLRLGSSPLYYVPEDKAKLETYVYALNEKDQKTVQLLKEQKVVQDQALEPLIRVSLRQVKDFATPLQMEVNGEIVLFWKWFSLSDEEAVKMIQTKLQQAVAETEQKVVEQKTEQQTLIPQTTAQQQIKTESQPTVQQTKEPQTEPQLQKEKPDKKEKIKKPQTTDRFIEEITQYFTKNKIEVKEQINLKKKNEQDFILNFPTFAGTMKCYCKTRKKSSITPGDVTTVFAQAQIHKLPAVLLTTGVLTKQAQALAEQLNITIGKIENGS